MNCLLALAATASCRGSAGALKAAAHRGRDDECAATSPSRSCTDTWLIRRWRSKPFQGSWQPRPASTIPFTHFWSTTGRTADGPVLPGDRRSGHRPETRLQQSRPPRGGGHADRRRRRRTPPRHQRSGPPRRQARQHLLDSAGNTPSPTFDWHCAPEYKPAPALVAAP